MKVAKTIWLSHSRHYKFFSISKYIFRTKRDGINGCGKILCPCVHFTVRKKFLFSVYINKTQKDFSLIYFTGTLEDWK